MKKIKNFNNYIEDMLLEKVVSNELPFILSKRLLFLLENINHPISEELLNYSTEDTPSKFTLVDFHDTVIDMFTYSPSNKVLDEIDTQTLTKDYDTNLTKFKNIDYSELFKKFRVEIKIGKFIKRLFGDKFSPSGEPGKDVESFVTLIKSERDEEIGLFEIVEGDDVVKYYYKGTYTKNPLGGSTLHSSCMMHDYCKPYIEFYAVNKHKVKLMIMKDETGNIKGRALIWDIDKMGNEDVNRKFMDRVYTSRNIDIEKFIKYATKRKWLYKQFQNSHSDTIFIDPTTKDNFFGSIEVHDIKTHDAYPYLDTLKFFLMDDGILTNKSETFDVTLESTSGGYTDNEYNEYTYVKTIGRIINNDELIYCEEEDVFLLPENTVYSDYNETYLSKDYANRNYKYSEKLSDWIPEDKAIYLGSEDDWISTDAAMDEYIQCGYDLNWYSYDDAYPSDEWGCVPANKSIVVINDEDIDLSEEISEMNFGDGMVDSRYIDDGTYFEVIDEKNNKTFYLDYDLIDSDLVDKIKKGDY